MPQPFTTLSPDQVAEVETLAAVLNAQQIADYFGMGRRTFYSLMERDGEVAARYKRGKARAVGSVAQSLISKARAGNVTAMIFYLKTQAGWRETVTTEITTGPVVGSTSAREQLMEKLERLAVHQAQFAPLDITPAPLPLPGTEVDHEGL